MWTLPRQTDSDLLNSQTTSQISPHLPTSPLWRMLNPFWTIFMSHCTSWMTLSLPIAYTISQTSTSTPHSELFSSLWRVADTSSPICPPNNANPSASIWPSHGVQFCRVPRKTPDIPAVEILADMWCCPSVPHPHLLDVRGRNHPDITCDYNDRRSLSLPRLSPVLPWAAGKCTCVCADS